MFADWISFNRGQSINFLWKALQIYLFNKGTYFHLKSVIEYLANNLFSFLAYYVRMFRRLKLNLAFQKFFHRNFVWIPSLKSSLLNLFAIVKKIHYNLFVFLSFDSLNFNASFNLIRQSFELKTIKLQLDKYAHAQYCTYTHKPP